MGRDGRCLPRPGYGLGSAERRWPGRGAVRARRPDGAPAPRPRAPTREFRGAVRRGTGAAPWLGDGAGWPPAAAAAAPGGCQRSPPEGERLPALVLLREGVSPRWLRAGALAVCPKKNEADGAPGHCPRVGGGAGRCWALPARWEDAGTGIAASFYFS